MSDIDINGDEVMVMDGYCDLFFIEVNRRFQVKSEDDQKNKQTKKMQKIK